MDESSWSTILSIWVSSFSYLAMKRWMPPKRLRESPFLSAVRSAYPGVLDLEHEIGERLADLACVLDADGLKHRIRKARNVLLRPDPVLDDCVGVLDLDAIGDVFGFAITPEAGSPG